MKTQHTPGPWARNISPAWKYPIYDEKNHNKIAYIIKDACISEAEQEANLNLIATAPELLEALELFLPMTKPGAWIEREALEFIHTTCKALISKAKGE